MDLDRALDLIEKECRKQRHLAKLSELSWDIEGQRAYAEMADAILWPRDFGGAK